MPRPTRFFPGQLYGRLTAPAPYPLLARNILRRTNDLLYKIHLLVQLPLWQYILIDYPQVGVITVTRTSKRID